MCPYPIYVKKMGMFVPCGKCGSCLKRAISDYTVRCKCEMKVAKGCYFVTLTYAKTDGNLSKSDLQKFFKRLRKAGYSFRYFGLGDYGDTFGRPHYHVIFFVTGAFPDPVLLHRHWNAGYGSGRGFVDVKRVSDGRIQYVVKYGFLAKLDWNKNDPRPKPFFVMSRRPAIGSEYIKRPNVRKWHYGNDAWYFPDGKFKKPLPRYFRDKLFSKPTREKHADEVLVKQGEARDLVLQQLAVNHSNPEEKLYERLTHAADLYLTVLRNQKRLKNKSFKT